MFMRKSSMEEVKKLCKVHTPEEEGLWYWWVLRILSRYLTWFLIRVGVTGNQLTVLAVTVGLLGSLLFLYQAPIYWILAWCILQLSLILDDADGRVARYMKTKSRFGWYVDSVTHPIVNAAIFVPISFSLYFMYNDILVFAFGFLASSSMLLLSLHRIYAFHLAGLYKLKIESNTETDLKLELKSSGKRMRRELELLKKPIMFFKRVGGVTHMALVAALLDFFVPPSIIPVYIGFASFRLLFLCFAGTVFPIIFVRRVWQFKKILAERGLIK